MSDLQGLDPLQFGGLDEAERRTACEDGSCESHTTRSPVLRDVSDSVRPLDGNLGLPRVGTLVRVQWRDAWFELDWDDETAARDDYLVHTVGFVIKNTDKFVHIAAEMLPDDGFRGVTAIPVTEITNWKEL